MHGEGYVSTEHLLLGLLREDRGSACKVLDRIGVSRERIRSEVEWQLPRADPALRSQDMTLTPRAKRVINLAYDEARDMGISYLGTEHLLLGLVREGDGLAGRVLAKCKVDFEACRKIAVELQSQPKEEGDERPPERSWNLFGRERRASPSSPTEEDNWNSYPESLFWDGRQPINALQLDSMHLLIRQGVAVPEFMVLAALGSDDGIAAKLLESLGSSHFFRTVTRGVLRNRSGEPSEVTLDQILSGASSMAGERGTPVTSGDIALAALPFACVPELAVRLKEVGLDQLKEKLVDLTKG